MIPNETPDGAWHVSDTEVGAYATLDLLPSRRASVESHLQSCARCRTAVAAEARARGLDARLDRSWRATTDRVDQPRRTWIHRLAVAGGVPDHLARLLGASAAFRVAWVAAVALVVAAGIGIAHGDIGAVPFLLLSPLVPVVGVAATYAGAGGARDLRSFELATPFGELRLLLIRTAAVTVASVLVLGTVSLLLPDLGINAIAWLLPALALTSATLALATRWPADRAALVVVTGWLVTLYLVALDLPRSQRPTDDDLGALAAPLQGAALVVLAVSATTFVLRRHQIERPTR